MNGAVRSQEGGEDDAAGRHPNGGSTLGGTSTSTLSAADILSQQKPVEEVTVSLVRRAVKSDAAAIRRLISPFSVGVFGNQNPARLIEQGTICISLMDANDELLAFGAFCDFPLQPRLSQRIPVVKWPAWLEENYEGFSRISPFNTLFCHLLVATPGFSTGLYDEIMSAVFQSMPHLQQVILMTSEDSTTGMALSKTFAMTAPCTAEPEHPDTIANCTATGGKLPPPPPFPKLFACQRVPQHMPQLHVRQARQSDYDDLVKIFRPQQLDSLVAKYGEYFLAEMVGCNNDEQFSFVAEIFGKPVGFCHLSTVVDTDTLVSSFELELFNNLCPLRPRDDDDGDEPETKSTSALSDSAASESQSTAATPGIVVKSPSPEPHVTSALKTAATKSGAKSTASVSFKDTSVASIAEKKTDQDDSASVQQKLASSTAGLGSAVKFTSTTSSEQLSTSDSLSRSSDELSRLSLDDAQHTQSVVVQGQEEEEETAQPCALCIIMFEMSAEYESRGIDFLPALFKAFPDREFIVMTQPPTAVESPMAVSAFVHVERLKGSKYPDELYVTHRHSLLTFFDVRPANSSDYDAIMEFISLVDQRHLIKADIDLYMDAGRDTETDGGSLLHVTVTYCLGRIICLAVLRDVEDPGRLRAHYDIDKITNFDVLQHHEHKTLHHFVPDPAFLPHQRFLLNTSKPCSITPVLSLMLLAKARRQIRYSKKVATLPAERIIKPAVPVSMFHINKRLLMDSPNCINARIVVVGASDAGMAVLDSLTNRQHIRFTNLVLIDPFGMPHKYRASYCNVSKALPDSLYYSATSMAQSGFTAWVNVIKGKMCSLNRQKQEVILDDRSRVPYDELIICTGVQFNPVLSVQAPLKGAKGLGAKALEKKLEPNVLTFGNAQQVDLAVKFVHETLTKTRGNVVVYGDRLEAYCAMTMLLDNSVSAKRLTLVLPPPSTDVGSPRKCFADTVVAKAMAKSLKDLGISVIQHWKLTNWTPADARSPGSPLKLDFRDENQEEAAELTADALFYFDKKTVDLDAFLAVNSSHLVFDRRLVVDENFQTADPLIHAAGTCTKYQLKLHRDEWRHDRYSSKEVGKRLGRRLLNKYDSLSSPTPSRHTEHVDDGQPRLTPWFEQGVSVKASLPGNYTYVHIDAPEKMDAPTTAGPQDKELSSRTDEGYIRLKFIQGTVKTITILTQKLERVEMENITALYGCHQNAMKSLLKYTDTHDIPDLFEFLREEWMTIFFHDRYQCLQDDWIALVNDPTNEDLQSLFEYAKQLMEVTRGTPDAQDLVELGRRYGNTMLVRKMQELLMKYLLQNHYHLPMYATTNMLTV